MRDPVKGAANFLQSVLTPEEIRLGAEQVAQLTAEELEVIIATEAETLAEWDKIPDLSRRPVTMAHVMTGEGGIAMVDAATLFELFGVVELPSALIFAGMGKFTLCRQIELKIVPLEWLREPKDDTQRLWIQLITASNNLLELGAVFYADGEGTMLCVMPFTEQGAAH